MGSDALRAGSQSGRTGLSSLSTFWEGGLFAGSGCSRDTESRGIMALLVREYSEHYLKTFPGWIPNSMFF